MRVTERPTLLPVMAFIGGNILFGTGLIFHAFLYNFYLEALHLSAEVMGHAAAALTGGGLVMLLPAGPFTDRAGPRAALTTAAVVLAVGLAVGAVAVTPLAIYAAAALAGAGGAIWRVAIAPILMTLTQPRTRARAFAWNVGLLVAWGGLGTALAGATSTGLEQRWGFQRLPALRAVLVLGAIASVASVALFRALHPPAGPVPAAALRASNLSPHPIRQMLPLIGLVAVWMLGPALAAPFFNIFFSRVHGVAIERIGFIFAAANLCWALMVLASGEVASRVGGRRVLVGSLLWFAPAMCGLSLAGTLQLAVVLYVLQGVIGPVTNPLIDQWLLGQTPRERQGLVSSWRQAAADASAMIGASVGGQLLARGGFDPLLLVAGAIGLVGAVGLIVGVHRRSDEP